MRTSSGISLHERAVADIAGSPGHPVEQLTWRETQGAGELYERVHAGDSFAALKLADCRAMKRSADGQLFLGEVGSLASAGQIGPEPSGDVDHRLSPPLS
jgi:hypothetical protein